MTDPTQTLTALYDALLAECMALVEATADQGSGASRAVQARATSILSAANLRRASVDSDLREADASMAEETHETRTQVPDTQAMMDAIVRAHRGYP